MKTETYNDLERQAATAKRYLLIEWSDNNELRKLMLDYRDKNYVVVREMQLFIVKLW